MKAHQPVAVGRHGSHVRVSAVITPP